MKYQTEIIKTFNLTKTYNGVSALKNLNLTVNKHSIFGFLGPNGAGKSTTIKLLIGLIQPTAGTGRIFGYDIKDESMKIRARIGYLPQEPAFYDHLSAREVLEFTARFFFSSSKKELNNRVSEMLELVSLLDKADRPIKGYSTGEKRRLGIAQATINYPDLLILDEPAASLDPIGRQDVLNIMSKLRDYTTIFYSTHILDDVQKVSDTVAILNKGQLIAHGPIEDILKNKEDESIFNVKVQGDISKVMRQLILQKWISNVNVTQLTGNSDYQLKITVSDDEYAQKNLIRELMNLNLIICEFQRQEYELEDVFMKLIEG
ncbi:MAG: ABC transporter ATP-binding protein [Candidatus Heimdallarchaeota archaeon]|nr:MAG: ABC transporter ATP-binding protein [Candidatus Heimdallarchaeota archaeon]